MDFNSRNPFPLPHPEKDSHRLLQEHSQKVDDWLGFAIEKIEFKLKGLTCEAPPKDRRGRGLTGQNLWLGLEPKDLLTPYAELRWLLDSLVPKPGDRVIDLGAAYGRLAFVLERHYPGTEFYGYEYVGERVQEFRRVAARHNLKKSRMEHCDLSQPSLELPRAKIFFLYDFGHQEVIWKTLRKLREFAKAPEEKKTEPFYLVARGRVTPYLIENHFAETFQTQKDLGFRGTKVFASVA